MKCRRSSGGRKEKETGKIRKEGNTERKKVKEGGRKEFLSKARPMLQPGACITGDEGEYGG